MFDDLTSVKDGNILIRKFKMAFNALSHALKDVKKLLTQSDTTTKYVAALRKDAERHPAQRDAHKEALKLVREVDRIKHLAPKLGDLQTAVLESIDLHVATVGEESQAKKDTTHKPTKSKKANKSKPGLNEETSPFGEHYQEKSKYRGKGSMKGKSDKGKGYNKGYRGGKGKGNTNKGYYRGYGKGYNAEATN